MWTPTLNSGDERGPIGVQTGRHFVDYNFILYIYMSLWSWKLLQFL